MFLRTDVFWSVLFSIAIAVLMLTILLVRTEDVETWVLVVYPSIGALLAHVASRTSPTEEGIAWIETSTIAAACIVVLASLVNLLLIELLVREIYLGAYLEGSLLQQIAFFALPTISALLWWALERRLSRMRHSGRARMQKPGRVKRTGPKNNDTAKADSETEEAA